MALTADSMRTMAVAKVHKDFNDNINSLDFHKSGEHMVVASDDESIKVYNCITGTQHKVLHSKKYGVDHIKIAPSEDGSAVIMASKNAGWDNSLRYLSLHTNRFLRYFKGHTAVVTSLSMSPLNDSFASAAADESVRLWDLRTNVCQAKIMVPGKPYVTHDPEGLCIGVVAGNVVRLYDSKMVDGQPFAMHRVTTPKHGSPEWRSLKFSPDGKLLLLSSTTDPLLCVVDAFTLNHVSSLTGHANSQGQALVLDPCWSPDGAFVLCGSETGKVHIWDASSGRAIAQWSAHAAPVRAVGFNPKYFMAASGCVNLAMWLPQI